MALAVEVANDRHQQGLARKAAVDEQLALEQSIDLAVALAVDRIVPMVERRAPMVEVADRLDRVVHLVVDLVEDLPALLRQAHIHGLELAERALLAVPIAEVDPAVGNRGFAADRRASGLGKAWFGGFDERAPGEGEDHRRGQEAKEPREHWVVRQVDGDTIAVAAWRARNKID